MTVLHFVSTRARCIILYNVQEYDYYVNVNNMYLYLLSVWCQHQPPACCKHTYSGARFGAWASNIVTMNTAFFSPVANTRAMLALTRTQSQSAAREGKVRYSSSGGGNERTSSSHIYPGLVQGSEMISVLISGRLRPCRQGRTAQQKDERCLDDALSPRGVCSV